MSVSLIVMFDPALPAADSFASASTRSVAAATSLLDGIARAKGLPPFSRFIPDLDEFDWQADEGESPEMWYDPADGLMIVSVLIEALRMEGKWAGEWSEQSVDEVVSSLELLSRDLEVAKQAGAKFSLSFV